MHRIISRTLIVAFGATLASAAFAQNTACWLGATEPGAAAPPFSIESFRGGEPSNDAITVPDGTPYGYKLVGQTKPSNIVLRRGLVNDDMLGHYVSSVLQGKFAPISGGCAEGKKGLNAVNVKLAFVDAVPEYVRFPALDANSNRKAEMSISLIPGLTQFSADTAGNLGITKLAPSRTYTAGRFALDIDGFTVPGVNHVNPFQVTCATDAVGNPLLTPSDLVIQVDSQSSATFISWRKAVLDGKVDRKSISIIFHNDAGEETSRVSCYNCWPRKHTFPPLAAISGVTTVTIAVGSVSFSLRQ